jgi:hypothetical protein
MSKCSTRDNAMKVEMGIEFLIPGMEKGNETSFTAQVIFTEGEQGLRNRFEEDSKELFFVIEDNLIKLMGECKDQVEIRYRK